jgi:transposase
MLRESQRFIGLDVHKASVVVAAVDRQQTILLPPRRIAISELPDWLEGHLQPTDAVVLEAGGMTWTLYDMLEPLANQVTVAHAAHVKLIASSLIKTDKRDALVLARLLAANLIPPVWVPPPHVRELRELVSYRRALVEQRSATKSRLRALLLRYQVQPPPGDIGAQKLREWWEEVSLPTSGQLVAQQSLSLLDHLSAAISEVDVELAQLSINEKWCPQVTCMVQLPGIGLMSAMTLLSAIGDISRFPSPKKLVGYSGLGVRIHSSGGTQHSGGITKAGRKELRTTLIEVAWVVVRHHAYWRDKFNALAERRGRAIAIVAIARKLLVYIWHVLTRLEADRHTAPDAIARSLAEWARHYRVATLLGLSRAAFVRRELDRLGTGQSLQVVRFSGRSNRLPPPGTIPLSA